MSDNGYQLKIENQIATLILDRPQVHNAFDDKLINDLIKALKQVEEDDSIRALILTSNGKHFSAGADLNWMKRMANLSESDNRACGDQWPHDSRA